MNSIKYDETQKMKTWWVLLICLLILGFAIWGFISQIILGEPWGNKPGPDWLLYAMLGLAVLLNLLAFTTRLILQINDQGIYIRYFPFTSKVFKWAKIEEYKFVKYDPIADYGGWGVRYNWKQKGIAYTVAGHYGISLSMKNGKRVLIGTRNPEELKAFVEKNNFKK